MMTDAQYTALWRVLMSAAVVVLLVLVMTGAL